MKKLANLFLLLLICSCADGIKLKDSDIEDWLGANRDKLEEIVEIFESNECLSRVEENQSDYIDNSQHCRNARLSQDIIKVRNVIHELGIVLVTDIDFERGKSVGVDIMLYRDKPQKNNKASALTLAHMREFPKQLNDELDCVLFKSEDHEFWYIWHWPGGYRWCKD